MPVFTITIADPQQGHKIGGRGLTQAGIGTNFSNSCNKAIKRLQLGCKNPKLRARRKEQSACVLG